MYYKSRKSILIPLREFHAFECHITTYAVLMDNLFTATCPHVIMIFHIVDALSEKYLISNKIPPWMHVQIFFNIIEEQMRLLSISLKKWHSRLGDQITFPKY